MCNNAFKSKAEVSFVKIMPAFLVTFLTAMSLARIDAAPNDSSAYNSGKLIGSFIRQKYKNENRKITINIGKNRLVLPDNCVIDVETGSGHGGYLNFFRLNLNGEDGSIEKISLNRGSILIPDPKEKCQAKGAVIKRKNIKDILEAIALLPAIKLIEKSPKKTNSRTIKNKDGTFTMTLRDIDAEWGSDSDFFVLVRALDENRKILLAKEYTGYSNSTDQLGYLPILAVCTLVEDRLDKIDSWINIPSDKWRESHLSDAFNLNRNLLLEDFHWWVLEGSLEGLAQAGNQSAQETIQFILAKYKDRAKRITNKLDAVTKDFDYWLSGAPKDLAATK
jgi:hypothetical protein